MSSSKSLTKLYQMTFELMGPKEALKDVEVAFNNVLHEVKEEGLDFSEEVLERKLEVYIEDFVEVYERLKANAG